MAEDCIFCSIIAGKIPCSRVYDDDQVLAFLDINPVSPGHTLVVPKRHFNRFDECPVDLIEALVQPLGSIAKAVVSATAAAGYNILNNNGKSAGQLIDHVHFHIIPRNPDDGVFNRWPAGSYHKGEIEKLAKKIQEHC